MDRINRINKILKRTNPVNLVNPVYCYSAFAPEAFTTLAHLAISDRM
jgi:hypothetical protein